MANLCFLPTGGLKKRIHTICVNYHINREIYKLKAVDAIKESGLKYLFRRKH